MFTRVIIAVFMIMGMAFNAHALTYTFYGEDEGGVGSATMDIAITRNTLTLTLDNTSPTSLIDPDSDGWNISAITGFGFNLGNEPLPVLNSWSLTAFTTNNDPVTMGASEGTNYPWSLHISEKREGVTLDYLAKNDNGSQNALYNPALWDEEDFSCIESSNAYLTTAVLSMTFNAEPFLATSQDLGSGLTGVTYVRFQRVGIDDEGSLKLVGTEYTVPNDPPGGGPTPVPEPGTIVLLGAGLLGLGVYARRRMKN